MLQNQKNQLRELIAGIKLYDQCNLVEHEYNGKIVATFGSTKLLQYSDEGYPLLIVPSLINKASILDITKESSLILKLRANGFKPFLIVWDEPMNEELTFGFDEYQQRLLQIIRHLDSEIALLGYCMGGFMSILAQPIASNLISKIITIATPWDFSDKMFNTFKSMDFSFLQNIGFVPREVIRDLFYMSNPFAANNKFIKLGNRELEIEEFSTVENWVNDGINMTLNLFNDLKEIVKTNQLCSIDLSTLNISCLNIIAQKDSVCPIDSTISLSAKLPNSTSKFYDCGHIGMIVKEKYKLADTIANWFFTQQPTRKT